MNLPTLFFATLIAFSGLTASAGASDEVAPLAQDSTCETFYEASQLLIRACAISITPVRERLDVFVNFPLSNKTVTAEFNPRSAEKFWNRLWFSAGETFLSKDEQALLIEALEAWGPSPTLPPRSQDAFEKARSVAEFLAEFLEPESRLEPFDRQADTHLPTLNQYLFNWTPICDRIGHTQLASYTAADQSVQVDLLVGDPATSCRGRCGWGCEPWYQWSKNQYTQECLNHDACHDAIGTQLGECKDEFWAAAASYTLAPSCPQEAQPQGAI